MLLRVLQLEYRIRLTGLRSAAHLNGREGIIRGQDPKDQEQWTARLEDGTHISVKAADFERVRFGEYTRASP
jgi:hypothetical protein